MSAFLSLISSSDFLHSMVLATVQGITEAFPISSSAHLALLSFLWNPSSTPPAMDVALHLGTFFALCIIFFSDVKMVLYGFFDGLRRRATVARRFMFLVVVSTLPVVIGGGIMHMLGFHHLGLRAIALNTIIFALILYGAHLGGRRKNIALFHLPYATGLLIGCFQILALFPGVSRLGITMTAGRLAGYSLGTSTHFAFLLAIPSIGAALVLKSPTILTMLNKGATELILMTMVSLIISLPAIWIFLGWIKRYPLWPLILYRLVLGGGMLWLLFHGAFL